MAKLKPVTPSDLVRSFGGVHRKPFYVVKRPSEVIKSSCSEPNKDNIYGVAFLNLEDGSCESENIKCPSLNAFLKLFKKTDSIWRYGRWNGEPLEYWRQKLIKLYPDTYKKQFAYKRGGYKDFLEEYLRKKGLLEWRPRKPSPPPKPPRGGAAEAPSKKRQRDTCEDPIAKRTCSFVPFNADEDASFASIVPIPKDEVAPPLNPEEIELIELFQCDGFKNSKIMSKAEVSQVDSDFDETSQSWNDGNPMGPALDVDFAAVFNDLEDSKPVLKSEVDDMNYLGQMDFDSLEPDFPIETLDYNVG